MNQPKTSRVPAPIYAAAGAGDLALEQLRKLPSVVSDLERVVNDLGGKAVVTSVELRQKAAETLRNANLTATGLREKATVARLREKATAADLDLDRLREVASRNAAVVLAGAQAAQERALAAYGALVARGERVVGAGVLEAAETVNADIETTEASTVAVAEPTVAPVDAELTGTPVDVARAVDAKPAAAKPVEATSVDAEPAAKPAAARSGATRSATGATAKRNRASKTTTTAATDTPAAKLPKQTKRTRPAVD